MGFGLFTGLWTIVWWPFLLFVVVADAIWLSSTCNKLANDDEDDFPIVQLGFSVLLALAIPHLFGLVNIVEFLGEYALAVAIGVAAYFVLGLLYVYIYRAPTAVERYNERMEERLEQEKRHFYSLHRDDPEVDAKWEVRKKEWKEEHRLVVSKYIGWLTVHSIVWGPDFLYRIMFRFWADMLETFWKKITGHLQRRFDKRWDTVGKDL